MNNTSDNRNALPMSYRLENYQIQSVLGDGGFGITYLAKDIQLDALVALKEYLPNELAVRQSDDYTVQPKSQADTDDFAWGLERFVKEAQTLAQFKHPNIVRVLHFFQAHNTAYIVMEYEQGQSLADFLKRNDTATEDELMAFLPALLDGLETVHNAGYLHRDIKPSNVYLRQTDRSPLLIDFGSARYDLGSRSRSVTMIVTPGYAPFEQYQSDGAQQGAWTDIYATGAVLYRFISGEIPPEATERVSAMMQNRPDPLKAAVEVGRGQYSQPFLAAIDWALAVNEQDRPPSIKAWRSQFFPEPLLEDGPFIGSSAQIDDDLPTRPVEPPAPPIEPSTRPLTPPPSRPPQEPPSPKPKRRGVGMVVAFLLLALLAGGGWLYYQMNLDKAGIVEENLRVEENRPQVAHVGAGQAPRIVEGSNQAQSIPPTENSAEAQAQREREARQRSEEAAAAEKARRERESATAQSEREARLRAEARDRAAAAQAQLPSGTLRIMSGAGVRLRQLPRRNAKKGAMLQIGTIVSELEKSQGPEVWYRIITPNYDEGWVYGGYTMSFNPDRRAQAYIEVANNKLSNRRASFGDLVDLYHFLSRANQEVELESAVELKLLRLLTLQRSLDHISSSQPSEQRYFQWINDHGAEIVYLDTRSSWFVKRDALQQLYDTYHFLPIAARIMQEINQRNF
jgi:serine/threonine protein kinase